MDALSALRDDPPPFFRGFNGAKESRTSYSALNSVIDDQIHDRGQIDYRAIAHISIFPRDA